MSLFIAAKIEAEIHRKAAESGYSHALLESQSAMQNNDMVVAHKAPWSYNIWEQ